LRAKAALGISFAAIFLEDAHIVLERLQADLWRSLVVGCRNIAARSHHREQPLESLTMAGKRSGGWKFIAAINLSRVFM